MNIHLIAYTTQYIEKEFGHYSERTDSEYVVCKDKITIAFLNEFCNLKRDVIRKEYPRDKYLISVIPLAVTRIYELDKKELKEEYKVEYK